MNKQQAIPSIKVTYTFIPNNEKIEMYAKILGLFDVLEIIGIENSKDIIKQISKEISFYFYHKYSGNFDEIQKGDKTIVLKFILFWFQSVDDFKNGISDDLNVIFKIFIKNLKLYHTIQEKLVVFSEVFTYEDAV